MNMQVGPGGAHPVVAAVAEAEAAVTGVRGAAVFGLSDEDLAEAIGGCERLRAVVFDLLLGLVAETDGRDLGRREGAASTASWLRDRYRIRPGDARRLVDLGNRSADVDVPVDYAANVTSPPTGRELTATRAALAEGVISPEHVAVVGKVMETVPASIPVDQARQAELDMAGFCRQYDPATVAKLGDYLLQVLAEDALDERDAERHRRRTLRFDEGTGGVFGTLTTEGMAMLRTALDPLAAPVPAEDGTADTRTPGQRLADALVELARRAIAADGYATNHGISHRVMLTIGLDTLTHNHDHECGHPASDGSGSGTPGSDGLGGDGANGAARVNDTGPAGAAEPARPAEPTGAAEPAGPAEPTGGRVDTASDPATAEPAADKPGADAAGTADPADGARAAEPAGHPPRPGELAWGGFISPAAARRLACYAGIQRVILDPMGAVLDVGREYRTVTPAQFAALIVRDGGCAFPGCTRPPAWCIAHHIKHWADGGPTDLDNLVLLCTYHHIGVHHHGWDITMAADRLPTFHPPPWIDPHRQPRRNNRPRPHQRHQRRQRHPTG